MALETQNREFGMRLSSVAVLEHVDIEVNHRCNLTCRHCSARVMCGGNTNELSLNELRETLVRARKLGLKKLGLTGGEPLIDVQKLRAIARFALDDLQVPVHTHVNGTLVTEGMCRSDGVFALFEAISVTFLGGNAEAHDKMTGVTGSFEGAVAGARILASARLPLTCYFIPTHGNCDGFSGLAERLATYGAKRIRAMALAPSGRARSIYSNATPMRNEMVGFEQDLLQVCGRLGVHVEAGYCTRLSMPGLAVLHGHDICMSALNRVHINSEGDVFPCTAASGVEELHMGNLRKNGFDLQAIWEKSGVARVIRMVHAGALSQCRSCTRTPKCGQGCTVNACGTMTDEERAYCPVANLNARQRILTDG